MRIDQSDSQISCEVAKKNIVLRGCDHHRQRESSESIVPPSGRFSIAADRAKNVNKIGQLARSVNKFPARSLAWRSRFASASRIMPSLAWLYSLNASASSCRSICVTM